MSFALSYFYNVISKPRIGPYQQRTLTENENEDYNYQSKNINVLKQKKSEGYRTRARITSFENNESNISYHSKLEKIKTERDLINFLYDENNVIC